MSRSAAPLAKTVFELPKMDCVSEEQMVRLALDGNAAVRRLDFNRPARRLEVVHQGSADELLAKLAPLASARGSPRCSSWGCRPDSSPIHRPHRGFARHVR